jgi:hypothetical protein
MTFNSAAHNIVVTGANAIAPNENPMQALERAKQQGLDKGEYELYAVSTSATPVTSVTSSGAQIPINPDTVVSIAYEGVLLNATDNTYSVVTGTAGFQRVGIGTPTKMTLVAAAAQESNSPASGGSGATIALAVNNTVTPRVDVNVTGQANKTIYAYIRARIVSVSKNI